MAVLGKLQLNLKVPPRDKVPNAIAVVEKLQVLTMRSMMIFGAAGQMHVQRWCNEGANKCNRTGPQRERVLISTVDKTKHNITARHRR